MLTPATFKKLKSTSQGRICSDQALSKLSEPSNIQKLSPLKIRRSVQHLELIKFPPGSSGSILKARLRSDCQPRLLCSRVTMYNPRGIIVLPAYMEISTSCEMFTSKEASITGAQN